MSRLDRYYIPPNIPAKPPNMYTVAPIYSQHRFPSSQPHTSNIEARYQYDSRFSSGPGSLPLPLPKKAQRRLQTIESGTMVDYEELPSTNITSALCLPESSPRIALQKILFLYECKKHREVANFMKRLNYSVFKSILHQLPDDIFIASMPYSLPILEALYAKMFLQPKLADSLISRVANALRPESVVWQLVKFFAAQEEEILSAGQMRWEFCGPFISSCKKLLTVLLAAEPRARRVLAERKNAIMKAIEGLGQHGLIGDSDGGLVYLHVALKLEFEKVRKSYEEAISKIEDLSLAQMPKGKAAQSQAPIAQSHQRQLSIKSSEVQERLIKNKTLLNVIEPTLENTSLEVLLGILQQRIELDKECLFQFTQVKKESHLDRNDQSVAPILMRYQRGCQQVLDLMREVSESKDDLDLNEDNRSDISGYHSDNESAVMTSGNSPFVSKEARFSFLSRSVRLGSKHNVRSSILASSLCLASLSNHGGSIRSQSCNGSLVARSDLGILRKKHYEPRSRLAIHSSSGVSSGSSSDSASNEDNKNHVVGPQSPALSVSSSQCTIKPNSICTSHSSRPRIPPYGPAHHAGGGGVENSSRDSSFSTMNGNEPIYQGINDGENNVTRKETEIAALKSEMAKLKSDLVLAQRNLSTLRQSELMLKERLADQRHRILTMEKMASIEKSKALNVTPRNYSSPLDERPAHLVRKYGELYSQLRLETLDTLDQLPQLVSSDELKIKLLFSVVVLAFRSVTSSKSAKEEQIRRILQLPPMNNDIISDKTSSSENSSNSSAAKELEEAINVYLRRATETFDLSKNVEEVCSQIWATLYDYPCLKTCEGIIKYVKECVRVAWGLVNQVPSYVIEYEARQFRHDLHVRYHNSDPGSAIIKTYLWPALLEGHNGPCVQKAVVIT